MSLPVTTPLSSISVTARETDAVVGALKRGMLSGVGDDVRVLEGALAAYAGRAHAIACNSGTSALEMALLALGLPAGTEVIVPSLTFAAPASAVVTAGLTPVLCDVDPATWTISVARCRELLTPRTGAVVAVDVFGNLCDYQGLRGLGVPIVQDAAEAIGAGFGDKMAGGQGDLSVLSFHANKVVSCGEGGALLLDDDRLAEKARLFVRHGMSPGYVHQVAGRNVQLGNLSAAFAHAQLSRLDELVAARNRIWGAYRSAVDGSGLFTQEPQPGATPATWLATFGIGEGRSLLLEFLRQRGIDARGVWPALSQQPFLAPWRRSTPVAEALADQLFWLPTFADLDASRLQHVINALWEFLAVADVAERPMGHH